MVTFNGQSKADAEVLPELVRLLRERLDQGTGNQSSSGEEAMEDIDKGWADLERQAWMTELLDGRRCK